MDHEDSGSWEGGRKWKLLWVENQLENAYVSHMKLKWWPILTPDSSININSLTHMYWASVAELIVPKVGAEPYTEVTGHIYKINQAP